MPKARTAEVDLARLCSSIRASRKVLEPFRVSRVNATRKYAGDQWSTETAYTPRPINFLSLYLQILSRNLVSHDPRVTLSTQKKQYKAVVSAMEDWVNPELVRMGFADTMHRAVVDAIYCVGITKVGLATPAESEMSGWSLKAGQPYAAVIDLDDWCMDPHARTLGELAWMGHRSRVRVDSITDSKLYDAVRAKKVQVNPDRQFNTEGDERISMLSRQYVSNDQEEAYEYCDLWEIYLPMEKLILTLLSEDGGTPGLIEHKGQEVAFSQRDYVGPYCGPYHYLNLMPPVSGNAMPKGPIQDLIGMDEAMNGITQKLIRQAARQKELLAYSGIADSDVARVVETEDGGTARVENVDKMKPIGFGGPHPNNAAFSLQVWDWMNKIGGNVELLGGIGEQSKTATQDKMLNANASMSVKWMQQATVKHASDVITSLCWLFHHHPQKSMTSYHPIPGLSAPIERVVTPADRQKVPFEAMTIRVDPSSLVHQTPQEKLAFLNQLVQQTVIPLMPILQQQGLAFDMARFLELVSKYGSADELNEIISTLAEPNAPQGEGNDAPAKPGATTRTYNRVNASEKTGSGQAEVALQNVMKMGQGGRPSTSNGSYQPVGGR